VVGQNAVDAIGEAPAPMVVEVPNRPAAEVMDEEDAEQDEDEEKEVVAAEESATSSAKRAKVGRKTKEKAHEKKTGSRVGPPPKPHDEYAKVFTTRTRTR